MADWRRLSFLFSIFVLTAACSGESEALDGGAADYDATGIDAAPMALGEAGAPRESGPPALMQANPGGGRPAAAALPQGAHRVKRTVLMDKNGFEKPLPAISLMIPSDWRGDGGVFWNVNKTCAGSGDYAIQYSASSPDGRSGLEVIPGFTWSWNNFSNGEGSGCPFLQIGGVQQFLNYFVSQARPGARVIDFRPRPDIADTYKMLNSSMPMAGGEMRIWIEAGEVLIAYQANGAEMRETIASVVLLSRSRIDGSMGMPTMEYVSGSALSSFAMRAPNGQLDFRFGEMVRKSPRSEPEWSMRIAQHNAKIAQANLKGARDRSAIIAQTGEEIRQMQNDSWRNQNETSDRMQRENIEAIRGVETYNDPYYGGTVQLDHTYEKAWQLDDGSYVLTNDVMFDPARDLGVNGQQLEVAQ